MYHKNSIQQDWEGLAHKSNWYFYEAVYPRYTLTVTGK